jgi:hypothetical protein
MSLKKQNRAARRHASQVQKSSVRVVGSPHVQHGVCVKQGMSRSTQRRIAALSAQIQRM